jgi:hypothetical protein
MGMNISSSSASDAALQGLQGTNPVDSKRLQLQTMLLRKTLDAQQQQSDALLNELQGKGQVVDIRV